MTKIFVDNQSLTSPAIRPAIAISRYLQVRHRLGKSIITCDNPVALLSATRKQWMKICRQLQVSRASTLNAEEILRHTRNIIFMQQLQFSTKSPKDDPNADIYFLMPHTLAAIPPQTATILATTPTPVKPILQTSINSIIIIANYDSNLQGAHNLPDKRTLELDVRTQWEAITAYLKQHDINAQNLSLSNPLHAHNLDTALEALVSASDEFIHKIYAFQQVLDAARPLSTFNAAEEDSIEAVIRLAYRVHTLTPSYALRYSNLTDSNFFLRDSGSTAALYASRRDLTYRLPHTSYTASAILST